MALYFSDFDEEKIAFVNPWDTTKKQEGFPSVAVSTFSADIVEDYVRECNPPGNCENLYGKRVLSGLSGGIQRRKDRAVRFKSGCARLCCGIGRDNSDGREKHRLVRLLRRFE